MFHGWKANRGSQLSRNLQIPDNDHLHIHSQRKLASLLKMIVQKWSFGLVFILICSAQDNPCRVPRGLVSFSSRRLPAVPCPVLLLPSRHTLARLPRLSRPNRSSLLGRGKDSRICNERSFLSFTSWFFPLRQARKGLPRSLRQRQWLGGCFSAEFRGKKGPHRGWFLQRFCFESWRGPAFFCSCRVELTCSSAMQ